MTEEEFMQLLAKQVQREVERQLAPIMTQLQQLLKSLQKTDDQKKHVAEDLRHLHRETTMLWEFINRLCADCRLRLLGGLGRAQAGRGNEDLRRLAGLDPAALPDKP